MVIVAQLSMGQKPLSCALAVGELWDLYCMVIKWFIKSRFNGGGRVGAGEEVLGTQP